MTPTPPSWLLALMTLLAPANSVTAAGANAARTLLYEQVLFAFGP